MHSIIEAPGKVITHVRIQNFSDVAGFHVSLYHRPPMSARPQSGLIGSENQFRSYILLPTKMEA